MSSAPSGQQHNGLLEIKNKIGMRNVYYNPRGKIQHKISCPVYNVEGYFCLVLVNSHEYLFLETAASFHPKSSQNSYPVFFFCPFIIMK